MKLCSRAWSEELVILIISSALGYKDFPRRCKLPLSSLSPPLFLFFSGGFLTLYIPFELILALHLLIMHVATRVVIPSAAFSNFLWVAATKVYYPGGHFLINAARSFSCGHLMRRWQLHLELLLHHAPMAGPQC